MSYIYGRNPVLDALRYQQAVQKIYLQHGSRGDKIRRIYRLAKQLKIPVVNADQKKLTAMVGNVTHQGIVASISPVDILPFPALLQTMSRLEDPLCLMMVDRIQDPHNMGAIIRSAEIMGVSGLVYSSRENVPITETVIKTSSGAAFKLPLYKTHNLAQAIDQLKAQGIWVYGADLESTVSLWQIDFNRNCAIVIGSEEKGLKSLLIKKCDVLFHIPQRGSTQSLNASVAAGIILAEMVRQRTRP